MRPFAIMLAALIIGAGTVYGSMRQEPVVPDSLQLPKGPWLGSPDVHLPGTGVSTPVVVTDRKPRYTPATVRAGVQGRVKMECVVLPDGTVGDVRVIDRLNVYLDDEAVRALREWKFKPGMKDGVAVPVRVEVEMTFTLRDGPRKSADRR